MLCSECIIHSHQHHKLCTVQNVQLLKYSESHQIKNQSSVTTDKNHRYSRTVPKLPNPKLNQHGQHRTHIHIMPILSQPFFQDHPRINRSSATEINRKINSEERRDCQKNGRASGRITGTYKFFAAGVINVSGNGATKRC